MLPDKSYPPFADSNPVVGEFDDVGVSGGLVPMNTKFSVSIGAGDAVVVLERSYDEVDWYTVMTDAQLAPGTSHTLEEAELNVHYRLRCTTYTSGPVKYRMGYAYPVIRESIHPI